MRLSKPTLPASNSSFNGQPSEHVTTRPSKRLVYVTIGPRHLQVEREVKDAYLSARV
jgi:hypothetical protein